MAYGRRPLYGNGPSLEQARSDTRADGTCSGCLCCSMDDIQVERDASFQAQRMLHGGAYGRPTALIIWSYHSSVPGTMSSGPS
jgi:hypothetical protein